MGLSDTPRATPDSKTMTKIQAFFLWLLGKASPVGDPLADALNRFRDPQADTLELMRRLVAALRPQSRRAGGSADRYQSMLDR